MQPLSITEWKWENIVVHFIVGLPTTLEGYNDMGNCRQVDQVAFPIGYNHFQSGEQGTIKHEENSQAAWNSNMQWLQHLKSRNRLEFRIYIEARYQCVVVVAVQRKCHRLRSQKKLREEMVAKKEICEGEGSTTHVCDPLQPNPEAYKPQTNSTVARNLSPDHTREA